jgi:predicted nuclease of predicted toxin-antitoxin system
VKLLLDQHLSYRLLAKLETDFPGSSQVHRLGMEHADDLVIWHFARDNGFAIMTKDSDFSERSLISGPPPQIIWLKCGNVSTRQLADLLERSREAIRAFLEAAQAACLEIYGP